MHIKDLNEKLDEVINRALAGEYRKSDEIVIKGATAQIRSHEVAIKYANALGARPHVEALNGYPIRDAAKTLAKHGNRTRALANS